MLRVSEVEHSLVSFSSQCDDGHTVKLRNTICVVMKANCVVAVGERAGGMYSVKLQCTSEKAVAAPEDNGDMLSVWRSKLVQVNCNTIKKMVQSNAVHSMDMPIPLASNNCSPSTEGKMTNTTIKYRTILETQPGPVGHTDLAGMNVTSVGGATYFETFIDEPSGHLGAHHMKTKREAADLLERHIRWAKRQTDCMVKKIVFNGEKEYM